jgi:RecB family exonuclease
LQRLLPEWLEVEREREPFEVQQMEAAFHFHSADLRFNLRVDRIDRLPDGRLVLLDYKSGDVSRDWSDERPENPQLPLYALSVGDAVTAVAYARVSTSECRFVGVAERAQILPKVDAKHLEGLNGMSAQLALWARRLALIAAELARGAAQVAPTKNACRSCSQQSFCRIAEQPALRARGDDLEGDSTDG